LRAGTVEGERAGAESAKGVLHNKAAYYPRAAGAVKAALMCYY
jgi:hypothetical protein